PAGLHHGGLHRRAVGPADRADHHDLLRQRLHHRPEGLRGRGVRGPGQLSAGAGRRAGRGPAGELQLVLGQRLQGSDRLFLHPAGAAVAVAARPAWGGTLMAALHKYGFWVFAAVMLLLPALPVPDFWITQSNYIGLYALVVLGLVLLTGVAGLISFGQAAFVGIGAYTAGYMAVNMSVSPWLSLLLGMGLAGLAAVVLGAITLRMSGHYL